MNRKTQTRIIIRLLLGLIVGGTTTACSGLIVIKPAQKTALSPTAAPTPLSSVQVLPPAETESAQPLTTQPPPTKSDLPDRIVAETINLDAPVVAMDWRPEQRWGQTVSVWNVPDNDAGWHANSARPGQGNNVVISGHNNSSGGHVFGRLDQLTAGDQVTIRSGQKSFVYQVSQTQIVRAFGASHESLAYLQAVTGPTRQEQLTLITCWPNWTNTHRFIVIAHPVP